MKLEGYSGNPVDVDEWGNIKTRSIMRQEMNDANDQEKSYSWFSTYTTAGAENVIYIKNTHATDNLEIHSIVLGTNTNVVFTMSQVTGTAAGTTITGSNMNLGSTQTASVTSLGNAAVTGLTTGKTLLTFRVLANYGDKYNIEGGVILTPNTAIAVAVSVLTTFDCSIYGHFNNLESK